MGGETEGRDAAGGIIGGMAEGGDQRVVVGHIAGCQGGGNRRTYGRGVGFPARRGVILVDQCDFYNQVGGLVVNPAPQVATLRSGFVEIKPIPGWIAGGEVDPSITAGFPVTAGQGIWIGGDDCR